VPCSPSGRSSSSELLAVATVLDVLPPL